MKKIALLIFCFALSSCATSQISALQKNAENATDATLTAVAFSELPNWQNDSVDQAVTALKKSCALFLKRDAATPVKPTEFAGTIAEWQAPCNAVMNVQNDVASARAMLEKHFMPYRITTSLGDVGLFTGYYETMLNGSKTKTAQYNVPLYARPNDLISVDLGEFRPSLAGERIAGKVVGGALKPYADRAAIDRGALQNTPVIAWVDDADAAFFLHIQGSGRVRMTDGSELRVGYDGQNGHVYTAIGRELIARGELTPETTNLESIRAWLRAHPDQAQSLREKNASYVFFKVLEGVDGPLGAQGVALTAERSMAVDPRFIAYGAPIYIDVPHPTYVTRINRLMVAQDTGGAIRGPVRGDVFWGAGAEAERNAGFMKSRGRAWVLLPKSRPATMRIALPVAAGK